MEQKKSNDNKPKFNYYWFYAIIAVVLISLNLFSMTGSLPEIPMSELTELIKKGDVQKIVIINKDEPGSYAEIYIDPNVLKLQRHKKVSTSTIGTPNT